MWHSDAVKAQLAKAALSQPAVVCVSPTGQPFGDTAVILRVDGTVLRILRERGQAFLELAAVAAPTEFHQYDDVEIAMGWKTTDQVLAKREREDIGTVLTRLVELRDVLSGNGGELAKARIKRAAPDFPAVRSSFIILAPPTGCPRVKIELREQESLPLHSKSTE